MTDKKTVEAVAEMMRSEFNNGDTTWEEDAATVIQAYQAHATIDDLKLTAKRLGVVVVPVEPNNTMCIYGRSANVGPAHSRPMHVYKAMIKAAEG